MSFDVKNENVEVTAESLEYYSKQVSELTDSLKEVLSGKYPQDALSILIQIDDVVGIMGRITKKHVTTERSEKHWSAVAKIKAREM